MIEDGKPKLKVLLAAPRGFCAGVHRAIEIVERLLERDGSPVYVRHEIVHNPHVVSKLREQGAVFVEELAEIPDGANTVFSAHGVARSIEAEAESRRLPVFDATCPLVTKVHLHGRRFVAAGRTIVLIGHAGHAEVLGTIGQIDAPVHLVSTPKDVEELALDPAMKIAYLTQTTLSVDDTREVIDALHRRFSDVVGPDVSDICYATQNRQNAVRDLSVESDLILVVGARNSSNSNRLRELAEEYGVPAHLLNDASELDTAWLDGVATVGITAGASAPEELVTGLIERIAEIRDIAVSQMAGIEENVSFGLPRSLRTPALKQAASR
ncbi:4-hydroxy-3-methylbut-2-enyl diphosphate reductase [Novosphingobium sp. G106]|uniref:4-hydroxy-3-methylbut-2-enyl diphosphate reductase n=1 Tax=Novosphingobium sp. G106 TaxID=2849500 RepID=UPI001C2D5B62|nr:4-hydroxy-3-methylbut-2-enyl diphosphate reductase [Novosphingobium sp. G106]MBV1688654.1 4-hydroxy-3-methylbut-2-enyl diphosphate reductase [Novosphingobium sp. G106]